MDYVVAVNQQISTFFVTSIPNVDPLTYKFLVPPYISDPEFLQLVTDNVFPTCKGLYPAIYYAILLSGLRYVLHIWFLKPLAMKAMHLKYPPLYKKDTILERKFPTKLTRQDERYINSVVADGNYSKVDLISYFK